MRVSLTPSPRYKETLAATITQLDVPGVRERVLDVLRGLLEELGSYGAVPTLSAQSNLDRDLGLGSLERVELVTRLETMFDVRLPDTVAADANTPEDLIQAILRAPAHWPCARKTSRAA